MPHPFAFSLLGGALIGLSAASLLFLNGRIAGVSGVLAGALWPERGDFGWRLLFVAGLVFGGAAVALTSAAPFVADQARSPWLLAAAGLLVGFGTRLGNGCTSGHGVCGVARLSRRSLVAVLTFVAVGMLTAPLSSSLGAVLFGVGWGLSGYCPGPAIVSLGAGAAGAWVLFAAMVAGMGIVQLSQRRVQAKAVSAEKATSAC